MGLIFQALDGESVLELVNLRQAHLQLSIIDLSALLLAKALQAGLVTGDRRLKALALAQGLPVHGVLWIMDEMLLHQILATSRAADALLTMLAHGARLPHFECQKRLEKWR